MLGFGMAAEHETTPVFSWEWFTVDGREHATKLREGGELRIEVARGQAGWEVAYTEFLTDVSLRMRDPKAVQDSVPWWRVRIARGSHVTWPSADEHAEPTSPNR